MQLESDQLRSSIASLLDSRSKKRLSQTGRALSAQRACESLRSGRCGQKNVCYPMHQNNCFVYPGDASGLDEASHCCFAEIRNLFAPKMSMAMIKRKGGDPSRIRKLWAVLWKSSERARKEEILTALCQTWCQPCNNLNQFTSLEKYFDLLRSTPNTENNAR